MLRTSTHLVLFSPLRISPLPFSFLYPESDVLFPYVRYSYRFKQIDFLQFFRGLCLPFRQYFSYLSQFVVLESPSSRAALYSNSEGNPSPRPAWYTTRWTLYFVLNIQRSSYVWLTSWWRSSRRRSETAPTSSRIGNSTHISWACSESGITHFSVIIRYAVCRKCVDFSWWFWVFSRTCDLTLPRLLFRLKARWSRLHLRTRMEFILVVVVLPLHLLILRDLDQMRHYWWVSDFSGLCVSFYFSSSFLSSSVQCDSWVSCLLPCLSFLLLNLQLEKSSGLS